jgi:uncharacterized membrane protein HdeD (DUF308 family)
MSINKAGVERIQTAVVTSLREHWVLYLVEGIILLTLGLAAIMLPPIATIAIEIVVGWVFLISGLVGLISSIRMRSAPGFWWSLLSALLGIVAGIILLGWPVSGVLSLTFVVIAFFLIEGAASVMYALEHRREGSVRWGWLLTSGVVDMFLAGIVFIGLPGTAAWIIGLLVGINMVFGGVALIAMALHARTTSPLSTSRST